VERFFGSGGGNESDTYGFVSSLGYTFTPRFTGLLGYNFTYLDLRGTSEASTTHNPTLGFSYRVTPALTVNASGGPAITNIGGQTFISPAANATLQQRLRFGVATLQYSRGVAVAGGFGGSTDLQTVIGTLVIPSYRDLVFLFSPAYSWSESVSRTQGQRVDVNVLSVGLGVSYRIAPYVSVFSGYSFLRQRTGGAASLQVDADQNRVRVGLQFGYPINFD
jgi:opacity protein-like surface antigen